MPGLFIIIFLFILGIIIGSFLNVIILRFDTGLSISKGRSKCFSCNKTLYWYELLPIISFIFQRGHCRGCFSKISWQYPLIELSTGFLFILAFIYSFSFQSISFQFFSLQYIPIEILSNTFLTIKSIIFLATICFFCIYTIIFVYDLKHKIIPDLFSYGAGLFALLIMFLHFWQYGFIDYSRVIAGPLLFLFFFFFWFISKGKWMGFGDAKLALSIGWFLGLSAGITAILLSFWIGLLAIIFIIIIYKIVSILVSIFSSSSFSKNSLITNLKLKSEIPFGPFMILSFLLVFIFNLDFWSLIYILSFILPV